MSLGKNIFNTPKFKLGLARALGSQSLVLASYEGGHISKQAMSEYFSSEEFKKIEAYIARKEGKK